MPPTEPSYPLDMRKICDMCLDTATYGVRHKIGSSKGVQYYACNKHVAQIRRYRQERLRERGIKGSVEVMSLLAF